MINSKTPICWSIQDILLKDTDNIFNGIFLISIHNVQFYYTPYRIHQAQTFRSPWGCYNYKRCIKYGFVNNLKRVKVRDCYQHGDEGFSYIKIKLHHFKQGIFQDNVLLLYCVGCEQIYFIEMSFWKITCLLLACWLFF